MRPASGSSGRRAVTRVLPRGGCRSLELGLVLVCQGYRRLRHL